MTKFIRGQVWHWTDPLFGSKEYGIEVKEGEQTLRYSRYVLLMENGFGETVTIIPLSTKYERATDYRVSIATQGAPMFSYARTGHIMPVSISSLDKYIGTIDKMEMDRIEALVIARFCPTAMAYRSLLEESGLPIADALKDIDGAYYSSNIRVIELFIKRELRTGGPGISGKRLFEHYCEWCSNEGFIPPAKEENFINILRQILRVDMTNGILGNVRIAGDPVISIVESPTPAKLVEPEQPSIASVDCQKKAAGYHVRWTPKEKRRFLEFRESHSGVETAEEFGITANLVYRYQKQFTKDMKTSSDTDEGTTSVETTSVATTAAPLRVNILGDKMRSLRWKISDISNAIVEYLTDSDVGSYYSNRKSEKEEFYKQLSSCVYYSFVEYLGIVERDDKTLWADAPEFLFHGAKCLNVEMLAESIKDGQTPMEIRKDVKEGKMGLFPSYNEILRKMMLRKFGKEYLTEDNIDTIISMVSSIYTLPPAA